MSISTASAQLATLTRFRFVAVGSETSISGLDADGKLLAYGVGKEQVYLNGVLLVRSQDYTASNGTSITALSALAASDVVEILTFSTFVVASGVAQTAAPDSPAEGQLWLDTDATVPGTQFVRWTKVVATAGTSISGNDDNSTPLSYTVGYEQIYINGVLLARTSDYTATNGSTVTLVSTTAVGDIIDIFSTTVIGYTDVYTQTQSDSKYAPLSNYYPAGKNRILNSDLSIWQRGTSVSIAASTGYTSAYNADRWTMPTNANQACTISRQATSDTTNLPFIQYCARIQRNSGQTGTGQLNWGQPLETSASIPLSGKTVVVSFYARSGANYSATSNALGVTLLSGTGTDQTAWSGYTGSSTVISQTATLTTTWQRFTYSATVPVTSTELSLYYSFTPVGTAGANDYFEVTGVQLEVGSSASNFSLATGSIATELAACQRYYWRQTGEQLYSPLGQGFSSSTTSLGGIINMPVTLRAIPTSVDYSGLGTWQGGGLISITSVSISGSQLGTSKCGLTFTVASGLTQYATYGIICNNNNTSYLGISAEL